MKCLKPSEMYLYLEEELPEQRKAEIKAHLKACPKCRKSLEERRVMCQAITKIPPYKAPPEFSSQVMSHIKPIRSAFPEWIQAVGAAVFFISVLSLMFSAFTRQGLTEFLTKLFQSIINSAQEILVVFVKFMKALSIFINLSLQLIGLITKHIFTLVPAVSPEIQLFTLLFSLLMALVILYSLKQKIILGDKR